MAENTLESGQIKNYMVQVYINGKMASSTKESIQMTRKMDSDYTPCKTAGLTRDGGMMENNMESVHLSSQTVIILIVNLSLDKQQVTKVKKGIWEDGKRIMWIENQAMAQKIESGEIDFRSLMQNPENKTKALVSDQANQFSKPSYLDKKFIDIITEVKSYNERL